MTLLPGMPAFSESSSEIMSGTLVFSGTRVPVKNLIDSIEGGDTLEEFLEAFPSVSRDHAIAALEVPPFGSVPGGEEGSDIAAPAKPGVDLPMVKDEPKTDVKAALDAALRFVKDLYSEQTLRDVLLEEVEFSEGDHQWLVTIGFSLPSDEPGFMYSPRQCARHYKEIRVDAETGSPVSMKIRSI